MLQPCRVLLACLAASVLLSQPLHTQEFWTKVSGPSGGLVSQLAINEDGQIFAATANYSVNESGGIFRSVDNGETWDELNVMQNVSFTAIAIDPLGQMYVVTRHPVTGNSLVLRSSDNGNTWVPKFSTEGAITCLTSDMHGKVFAAVYAIGIYRSTDGGTSWDSASEGLTNFYIRALATNSAGYLFAGTDGGIFRSTNSGESWEAVNAGLTAPQDTWVQSLVTGPGDLVFAGTYNGIFRSSDSGGEWIQMVADTANSFFQPEKHALAFAPGQTIYAATSFGFLRSTDNGDNWSQTISRPVDPTSMVVSPGGDIFAGSIGVFRSIDKGDGWTYHGLTPANGVKSLTLDVANHLFAQTEDGIFFRSSDDGNTWAPITDRGLLSLVISPNGVFFGWINDPFFRGSILVRSTNEGNSWSYLTSSYTGAPMVFDTSGNLFLVDGGRGPGVWRSTDNGDTWVGLTDSPSASSLLAHASGHLYAADLNGIFRSNDAGATWTQVAHIKNVFVLSQNWSGQTIAAVSGAAYNNPVYTSTDGGDTWDSLFASKSGVTSLAVNSRGDVFVVPSNFGVYRNTTQLNGGMPNVFVYALLVDRHDYLYAATSGGLYRSVLSTTGVNIGGATTPVRFELKQNYPNPFNPTTTIQYSIVNTQYTILTVYDVLGREIATLVNEVKQPGTYKVEWNAQGTSSGVYFYRLQAGSYTATKKLLLIR